MLPDSTTPEASAPGDEDALLEANDAIDGDDAEAGGPDDAEEADEPEGGESPDENPELEVKPLTKSARERAKVKARFAVLEESAARDRQRADAAEAQLRALTDDLGPEPKEADFQDEKQFIAALAAYKADERAIARQKKAVETQAVETRKSAGQSGDELFRERVRALEGTHPGIEKAIFTDDSLPISPAMAEVIRESPRGAEVAFYLSSHREEAQRIRQMPPLAAARELGRLEATLTAPKPRTQTQAPKPVPTVSGGGTRVAKNPERMGHDEFRKWSRAQEAEYAKAKGA